MLTTKFIEIPPLSGVAGSVRVPGSKSISNRALLLAGFAEAVARAGAIVGICARRADRLAEVEARCKEAGATTFVWVTDLADPAQVDELAREAVEQMGGVDVLVNNAGIPKRRHVTQTDAATVDRVTRINYLSPIQLTLALLPQMLERHADQVINAGDLVIRQQVNGCDGAQHVELQPRIIAEERSHFAPVLGLHHGVRMPAGHHRVLDGFR